MAGVLGGGITSCSESFEPTVDYGDNTYINDYSTLIAAVNNLSKSLSERFDALNQLLEKKLADIKLSIDANTGAITVLNTTTQNGFSTLNTTLFNGFETLNSKIDAMGQQIVSAINKNGELLRLEIDETGKLLSAALGTLNGTQEEINKTLGALLEAFSDFAAQNSNNLQAINATIDSLNTALANLGLKIEASIDEQTGKLVTALTQLGTDIAGSIAEQTAALNQAITDQTTALISKNTELTKAITDAIEALQQSNEASKDAIIAQLQKMLEDDGIYMNGGNLYMEPSIFAAIESRGTSSSLYQAFLNALPSIVPAITTVQQTPGGPHTCAKFNEVSRGENILVAGEEQEMTLANNKTVVRVISTPSVITYQVTIPSCAYPYLKKVVVTDAQGTDRVVWTGNAQTTGNIELRTYYKGKIVTAISATAYSNIYTEGN